MEINLLPIINVEGKRLQLDSEIDFSSANEQGIIFLSPAKVTGEFLNIGGSIELSAEVTIRLGFECDRCCENYEDLLTFDFKEVFKKEEQGAVNETNPDVIFFKGNVLELDGVVLDNIFVNLPFKRLCSPDCMGLCSKCGKNLNDGECNCDKRVSDPRFDVLDKFFD